MKQTECARIWQAEAVLDGELSRADAASFERHLLTCEQCAAARVSLLRLAEVAQRLPALESNPLRRRALHHELLRRAHRGEPVEQAPTRNLRRWLPLLAGLLLVALLVVPRWRSLAGHFASPSEPHFELTTEATTRWRLLQKGALVRVGLESGALTVAVNKLEAGQGFIVVMPDGELEVRGTRFRVEVDQQHTEHVRVDEGRVALRLHGASELSLGRGQSFTAPSVAAASSTKPSSPAISATAQLDEPRIEPTRAGARKTATGRASTPHPVPLSPRKEGEIDAPPEPASNAARDFREAMGLFSHGDFGSAERQFKAFQERYPTSQHNEDILFLLALGRSRRGDDDGARVFARDYLRRYPHGFRASEAARLAAEPKR